MPNQPSLDPALTINEIILAHPQTVAVFNRFGIDACCGGGVGLDEAATRDGADAQALRQALNEALASEVAA